MNKRIHQLPTELANQIAAGEVIERPASVLKELLENSLDAGCDQVDITIERGGIGLIRVQDNGSGICKEDLELALRPHATSKIASLSDLESVMSYGFRGEALASISAVSRLKLCSFVEGQEFGWCIETAGRDATLHLRPAPKRAGTLVEVRDLFFNTPARRHFLRSEKTELSYLEEVFKRIALSQPLVCFKFQQGAGLQKRLPICKNKEAEAKRVALLCGQSFIDNAYFIEAEANGLRLRGWLGSKAGMRAQTDLQYFYVNGRIVRDKIVMHALRQAFQDIALPGRYPAYVLYFELDPEAVDVNVHPTKHEVRFRESRMVHAFLSYAVKEGLKEGQGAGNHDIKPLPSKNALDLSFLETIRAPLESVNQNKSLGKPFGIIGGEFLLTLNAQSLGLMDVKAARRTLIKPLLTKAYEAEGVSKRPLLMPKSFVIPKSSEFFESSEIEWDRLGFEISCLGHDLVLVRSLPMVFGSKIDNLADLLPTLLSSSSVSQSIDLIVEHIIQNESLTEEQLEELWVNISRMDPMPETVYREVSLEKLREWGQV